jgi:hypothetical protein
LSKVSLPEDLTEVIVFEWFGSSLGLMVNVT